MRVIYVRRNKFNYSNY